MDQIKRLNQIVTEDNFSKANYFKVLKLALKHHPHLLSIKQDIYTYLDGSPSEAVKDHLTNNKIGDSALSILLTLAQIIPKGTPFSSLCGILAIKLKNSNIESVGLAADMLALVSDLKISNRGTALIALPYVELPEDIILLEQRLRHLPPMIVKPTHLSNELTSGHLTFDKHLILGKFKSKGPFNIRLINMLNSIEFSLNMAIVNTNRPLDDNPNSQYFITLEKEAIDHMLEQDNTFHFTHNFDTRGRFYCEGYQLNYQGDNRSKSLIQLKKTEKLW